MQPLKLTGALRDHLQQSTQLPANLLAMPPPPLGPSGSLAVRQVSGKVIESFTWVLSVGIQGNQGVHA